MTRGVCSFHLSGPGRTLNIIPSALANSYSYLATFVRRTPFAAPAFRNTGTIGPVELSLPPWPIRARIKSKTCLGFMQLFGVPALDLAMASQMALIMWKLRGLCRRNLERQP